jgi:peroxiredoxin
MTRSRAALALLLVLPALEGRAEDSAHDFELYDLGDRLLSLKKLRASAKLVVVDFFAESCAPCKAAIPAWKEIHRRHGPRGLALIVVAVPDDESDRAAALERVARYFQRQGVRFPVAWDKYRRVAKQYGVAREASLSVPQVFLLDREGALLLRTDKVAPIREAIERRLR